MALGAPQTWGPGCGSVSRLVSLSFIFKLGKDSCVSSLLAIKSGWEGGVHASVTERGIGKAAHTPNLLVTQREVWDVPIMGLWAAPPL